MQGITLAAALFTGLAGSLHCVGTCLGISASLVVSGHTPSPVAARSFFLVHLGRIAAIVAGGAVAGAAGGLLVVLRLANVNDWLQWGTAALMAWTGLSVAGLLPTLRMPLRAGRATVQGDAGASSLLLGIAWGLIPCGMVYVALFAAALTGSAAAGAAYMAAFALGTLPALAVTSWSVARLAESRSRWSPRLRVGLGSAILLLGMIALIPGSGILSIMCGGV